MLHFAPGNTITLFQKLATVYCASTTMCYAKVVLSASLVVARSLRVFDGAPKIDAQEEHFDLANLPSLTQCACSEFKARGLEL